MVDTDKPKTIKEKFVERFVNILLILNLISAFLLTDGNIVEKYGRYLDFFCDVSIVFFVIEISYRIFLCGKKGHVRDFFYQNGEWQYWNIFDFGVTFLSAISLISGLAVLVGMRTLRLLKLLNTVKLFARQKRLQSITEAIVASMPPIFGAALYFTMLYSTYAIMGISLYKESNPEYFGNLGVTFVTLFQVMTLDDWTLIMKSVTRIHPYAWIYFISFVLIASYVLLNLIVGIIVDSLQTVREKRELATQSELNNQIKALRDQLKTFEYELEKLESQKNQQSDTPVYETTVDEKESQ